MLSYGAFESRSWNSAIKCQRKCYDSRITSTCLTTITGYWQTILEFATTLTTLRREGILVETCNGKAGSQLSHNSIRITGFAPRSRPTTQLSSFNCEIKRRANRAMLDIGT
jgi:hypothetical protein